MRDGHGRKGEGQDGIGCEELHCTDSELEIELEIEATGLADYLTQAYLLSIQKLQGSIARFK